MQDIQNIESKELSMWEDELTLKDIKDIYAPKASPNEFKAFIQMGKATGLNPFTRDIWLIKYDEKSPAQIFIARDGYRKSISRNPQYDCHHVDAVYSNDKFRYDLNIGKVDHQSNFKDRGNLVGAFCLVFMKNRSKPFYVFCEISEYNKKRSTWNDIPATMIKKVAEAQCLRMACPEIFSGSYSEDESNVFEVVQEKKDPKNHLKQLIQQKSTVIEPIEPHHIETGEILITVSVEEVEAMINNAKTLENLAEAIDMAK